VTPADVLVVTGMAFEARIAAGPRCRVVHGLRAAALERELERQLDGSCHGIISFGVAGGLDAGLAPGDTIVADGVQSGDSLYDTDSAWARRLREALPRAKTGLVAGSDHAVLTVADKLALQRASGALSVDMESHIAARVAQARRVPFAVCRVVVDPATRPVPALAAAGMGENGETDVGAVVRGLLRAPQQLPALLRLAGDASAARAALRAVRESVGDAYRLPGTD
jgi:hopanoid-associated phosphorylase